MSAGVALLFVVWFLSFGYWVYKSMPGPDHVEIDFDTLRAESALRSSGAAPRSVADEFKDGTVVHDGVVYTTDDRV